MHLSHNYKKQAGYWMGYSLPTAQLCTQHVQPMLSLLFDKTGFKFQPHFRINE